MTGFSAVNAKVLDVIRKLDSEFSAVATAVANGEFALWVGSGISRRAPNLGGLIERAIEFLRSKTNDPATHEQFGPALEEALRLAEADLHSVSIHFARPFSSWPKGERDAIVNRLWNKYSALLDVRIQGKEDDYLLWEGVDIRDAFANPQAPAAEHLCIGILLLEGAFKQIASANWDGFIETAVEQLAGSIAGNLQVVVDPDHLRDGAAKAQLLKFHGCIVHATENPASYRKFLTGSETQINNWAEVPIFRAMVDRVVSTATNNKALLVGLSLQDSNLQSIFARSRQANAWPWPCAPAAQGHVFCEAKGLGPKQYAMLKTVYANYNDHIAEIQAGALLPFWPEQVLPALALHVVTGKMIALCAKRLSATELARSTADFSRLLISLRDSIAGAIGGEHTDFVNSAISCWSRIVCIFRDATVADHPGSYQVISTNVVNHVADDRNVVAAGFGDLAVALALLQHGCESQIWSLSAPTPGPLTNGAVLVSGAYVGASIRTVFIVRGGREAIELNKVGAFANDNVVVIHGDDIWDLMNSRPNTDHGRSARTPSRAPGRTGRAQTLHVSLKQMIESERDLASLQKRFIGKVIL